MLIRVHHRTRYVYDTETRYSVQTLRLTPQSFDGQRVLEWKIDAPGMEKAGSFRDCYGNMVHQITVTRPHTDVVVDVTGFVETFDRAGVVRGLVEVAPVSVYLRRTPPTEASDAIRKLATVGEGLDYVARLHALMHATRDAIDYVPGATNAHTSAAEALDDGKGVCQDHAHVMIAALRSLDRPARYVTGYLVGEAEAGHAWVEAFVDGLGWVGFDPANRVCPTDTYVRLAAGLDAATATPVRGARRGGGKEALEVAVDVAPKESQQQSPSKGGSQSQSQSQS
ncbi:MAG: transglutaminase domain-containing protein [Hyphomicrobiaceae bacterium]